MTRDSRARFVRKSATDAKEEARAKEEETTEEEMTEEETTVSLQPR